MIDALAAIVGSSQVEAPPSTAYLHDATIQRGLRGEAAAVVRPGDAGEVAAVVAWCYANEVPIVPRGGGSGLAGGAVPLDAGAVVLSLERMVRVRSFDPLLWRMEVEAGMLTADVQRLARENGLWFPPDPGAAGQSQIGGSVATNAGGPHAFRYGQTGAWVTGVEAVVAPGSVVRFGGPVRKDVAGYDLKDLLVGSEGTLGVITAVWLRFIPAPERAPSVVAAFFDSARAGCRAVLEVLGSGIRPEAIEFVDGTAFAAAAATFPGTAPSEPGFVLLVEHAAGSEAIGALLSGSASHVERPNARELWRWRDSVHGAVVSLRGGKLSEDVAVPVDRLADALERLDEIGARHGLETCAWGHAGDGNIHATFLIDPAGAAAAERAASEVFDMAVELGGTVTGEHGVGWLKRGRLARQWAPAAVELHGRVKQGFDPKGLFNPGKKA